MIYKLTDGTRVRVTVEGEALASEGEPQSLRFETYHFDSLGVKQVDDVEVLSGPEATARVTRLTLADGLRFVEDFGMKGQHL